MTLEELKDKRQQLLNKIVRLYYARSDGGIAISQDVAKLKKEIARLDKKIKNIENNHPIVKL